MKHVLSLTVRLVFFVLMLMFGLYLCYLASESIEIAVKLAITVAVIGTLAAIIVKRLNL